MSTNKFDRVGEIITYDMPDSKEVLYSDVLDALRKAGLDEELAKEMSPRKAFSRACKELRKDRVIQKVVDEEDTITFQFNQKALEDKHIEYPYEATIELNKETGKVTCSNSPELELHAQDLLDAATRTRNSNDVTGIVKKVFSGNAALMPLNKKGVAYFVAEEHRPFVDKVEVFFASFGGRLQGFPITAGDERGKKSLAITIADFIDSELEAVNAELEELDVKTRSDTFAKKAEKIKLVNHRLSSFSALLGDELTRISEARNQTRDKLLAKFREIEDAKAQEAAAA